MKSIARRLTDDDTQRGGSSYAEGAAARRSG
jgi:hypothetical protein